MVVAVGIGVGEYLDIRGAFSTEMGALVNRFGAQVLGILESLCWVRSPGIRHLGSSLCWVWSTQY